MKDPDQSPVCSATKRFTCSTEIGMVTTLWGSFSMPSNAAGTGGAAFTGDVRLFSRDSLAGL